MRCTKLYEELCATESLPSPRGVALDLLRLLEDEESGLSDVANVVEKDPAISVRLLQCANAAGSATKVPATTVQDACNRLGTDAVQSIALGFSVLADNRDGTCELFDYERFWSRSLAAASAMKQLAVHQDLGDLCPEEAFVYGLLGRIGRLGLVSVHPERYGEILRSLESFSDAALENAEEQGFHAGTDWLSALMMNGWGLPRYRKFLDPMYEGEDRDAIDIFGKHIHLAEAMASALISPRLSEDLVDNVGRQCAALKIQEAAWAKVLETTVADWNQMGRDLLIRTRGEMVLAPELVAVVS